MSKANHNNANPGFKFSKELRTLLLIAIPVVAVTIGGVITYNINQPTATRVNEASLIRNDSPTLGPDDAPVTLVEFLDPECAACGAGHQDILEILEDYEGQIRYVVRYFPNHANSTMAIAATEAAGEQGMYWEMQNMLFARQSEWIEQTTPQTDRFIAYAKELGLDIEAFTVDIQNPAYAELSERDLQVARSLSLFGTPAFFVNGQLLYGIQENDIRELIEKSLANR